MIETGRENLYISQWRAVERELLSNGCAWTGPIRQKAMARFSELGFPTAKSEEWKYTNLTSLAQIPFRAAGARDGECAKEVMAAAGFAQDRGIRLVFVNGYHAPTLSSPSISGGAKIVSLGRALGHERDLLEPYLGKQAGFQQHPLVALNTALMRDGAVVVIPPDQVIEQPIHLLFISTARQEPVALFPRNLIVAGAGSQARVVESYFGADPDTYFTNAVTEIRLEGNARLDHCKVQHESVQSFHVGVLDVRVGRHSAFTSDVVSLGARLCRNEVHVTLAEEGGECVLQGLYLAKDQQHVDNHTRIDHTTPHGTSRELYKGILDGRATGVFNGKIYVHPLAHETDAKQINKNLLLSRDASVDSKPQLEIYNNDVKCSHGSTIGRLDENAVFYLRTRGLSRELACRLLVHAFAEEMSAKISVDSVRVWLEQLLFSRL
jgi:Fe-S cluster assembly protein SufD